MPLYEIQKDGRKVLLESETDIQQSYMEDKESVSFEDLQRSKLNKVKKPVNSSEYSGSYNEH